MHVVTKYSTVPTRMMNRSEQDAILLDEKIARIRKRNEEIMKRKQEIDDEIAQEKQQKQVNHSIFTRCVKDEKPTLYSDVFASKKALPSSEDAAWRAERDQIDRERILRQRSNNGWKREWDADKIISNEEKHLAAQSPFVRTSISKDDHQSSRQNGWRSKSYNNTWDRNLRTDSAPRRHEDEKNLIGRRVENNQIFVHRRNDTLNNWDRCSNDNSYTKSHPQGSFFKSDGFSNHHNPKQCRIKNNGDSTTDWMKQQNENFLIDRKQPSRDILENKRSNLWHRVKQHFPQKSDVSDDSERVNLTDNLKNITVICDSVDRGKRLAVLSKEPSLLSSNSKLEPFNESIVEKIRVCVTDLSDCEISKTRIALSKSLKLKTSIQNKANKLSQSRRKSGTNSGFVGKLSSFDLGKPKRDVQTQQMIDQTVPATDDNDDEWEDISSSAEE